MTPTIETWVPKASHAAKLGVACAALVALGVGFEFLSRHSDEMRREIADWDDGHTLCLGVLPHGPQVYVQKAHGVLDFLGAKDQPAQLKVLFKNADAAFLVLSGQIGAHTAFAEHRAIVHGDIAQAMQANRAMAIVVKYLFPGLMLRRITRRMPTFTTAELVLKGKLYAHIGPALVHGLLM